MITLITLNPRLPYDFNKSALIFKGGDPNIRTFHDGVFHQILEIEGIPVLLRIREVVSDRNGSLSLEVSHESPISQMILDRTVKIVEELFNLQDDLEPFYRECGKNPELSMLLSALHGVKSPTTPTVYEALVDSIIEQQISLSVAYQLEHRLIRQTGKKVILDGETFFCYPRPETLADTPMEIFRECGLTTRKAEYIRDISRLIKDGNLDIERLRGLDETESIIKELCSLRGIGRWTAELTVLRGIHKMDAFPVVDIALRRMMGEWFREGRKITPEEALRIAEPWGRWKGLVTFYLEVADRMKRDNLL